MYKLIVYFWNQSKKLTSIYVIMLVKRLLNDMWYFLLIHHCRNYCFCSCRKIKCFLNNSLNTTFQLPHSYFLYYRYQSMSLSMSFIVNFKKIVFHRWFLFHSIQFHWMEILCEIFLVSQPICNKLNFWYSYIILKPI